MSTLEAVREDRAPAGSETAAAPRHPRLAALWFWIKRYAPPEISGTLTMVAAGLLVSEAAAPAVVVAIVGSIAESVGFYAVAGIAVWREQRRNLPGRGRVRILLRVLGLLVVEFGPAELIDTLLIRPGLLTVALFVVPHTGLALIAGKVVADVAFYVLAATAFRVSEKTGIRGASA
ncbi:hypothetical protein [Microbacterium candidum]|uniref:Uncharacterized protein n=1 Tax=Microbacterium candidum TaxID=3041922 RepID=A0ABT7N172_9MICO|nr:hypothetical protein [Microbacterium sp. ASV49]MDL9980411.1 hypothetical protein [Microbacterium sp. ASV49]